MRELIIDNFAGGGGASTGIDVPVPIWSARRRMTRAAAGQGGLF